MASMFKSGSSKRKAGAPGKLRISLKGFQPKKKGSDEDDKSDASDNDDDEESAVPDDLPEGTVVVQPEAVEDSPMKKKKEAPVRIDTSILDNVSCTACGRQLNPYKGSALQKHPELKVVICKRCEKFLSSGEIAKDEDGIDEQCRWCGEGGRLVVCDDCSAAFCKACVMRNFNRSEFNNINSQSKWQCYLCDKAPLQPLRENYRNIRDTLKALHARDKAKEAKAAAAASGTPKPTSNGTKRSGKTNGAVLSKSAASSSSSSSFKAVQLSTGLSSSTSPSASASPSISNVILCSSDLSVKEENVVAVMDKLSTATSTFKEMLRALRSQFHATSPRADDEETPTFNFSLGSNMPVTEKQRRCAKALNSSLATFMKSLKTILASAEAPPRKDAGKTQEKINSTSNEKPKGSRLSSASTTLPSVNGTSGRPKDNRRISKNAESSSLFMNNEVETISLSDDSEEDTSEKSKKSALSNKKSKEETSRLESSKGKHSEESSKSSKEKESKVSDKGKEKENKEDSGKAKDKQSYSKNAKEKESKVSEGKAKNMEVESGEDEESELNSSEDKDNPVSDNETEKNKDEDSGKTKDKKSDSKSSKQKESKVSDEDKDVEEDSEKDKEPKDDSKQERRMSSRTKKDDSKNSQDKNESPVKSSSDSRKKKTDTASSGDKSEDEDVEDKENEGKESPRKSRSESHKEKTDVASSGDKSEDEDKEKEGKESPRKSRSESRKKKADTASSGDKSEDEDMEDKVSEGKESPRKSRSESRKKKTDAASSAEDEDMEDKENEGKESPRKSRSESRKKKTDTASSGDKSEDEDMEDKDSEVIEPTPQKDNTSVSDKSENKKADENLAAKFDLMKQLTDEMLKTNEVEEEGNSPDDEDESVDEEPSKPRSRRKAPESKSDKSEKKATKTAKESSSKSKKNSNDEDDSDKDSEINSSVSKSKKGKEKEVVAVSDDASSSDVLMSSDDETPLSSRRKKTKSKDVSVSKEKEKEDKKVDKSAKESRTRGKGSLSNGSVKSKSKSEKASAPEKSTAPEKPTPKTNGRTRRSKNKAESDEEEEEDEDEKEIKKLAKMPVMRKRKAKDSSEENEDEVESTKDTAAKPKPGAKKSKPGPKSSKKDMDFEDLSSDGDDDKVENVNDEDEDDDEDLPQVTFCVAPNIDDEDEDEENDKVNEENEMAKNGLLDEMDSDEEDKDSDDSDDDDDDSDEKSSKKKDSKKADGKGKKGTKKDDDDEDDSDDSDANIGKKKKQIKSKLLDTKLSDSDSDVVKKKKKKKDDENFKADEEDDSSSGSSSDSDDLSENDESEKDSDEEDDSDSKSKKKTKKKQKKKKKGKGKGKGKKKGSDEDEEEEEEDEENEKTKGKGRKRKRIKKMADDSSDEEAEKKSGSDDDDDDDEKTPGQRKKIRRVMSSKNLEDSTRTAAKAEEKRRKRIAAKQREFNIETITDDNNPMNVPITTKLVLEPGKEEGDEPIVQVNKKLVRKLKPHQVEACQFMWDCMFESVKRSKKEGAGCMLAHCMGLGKTLSVISFVHTILSHEKVLGKRTCLVVSPLNTVLNWQNEWTMWFDEEDQLDVWELASCKQNNLRAKTLKEWQDEGGIMIIGYEMFRNLTTSARVKNKRQKKVFYETLVDPGPDLVVCDEGHILKNEASALSKAMNQMKTRRRVVLTGTPLQNNLSEYHCMVSFVKPNLLGTRKEFTNRFVSPINNGQCTDSTPRDVKLMKSRAHVLHEMLAGCVQRRDYSALTKFLPPKQEYVISVRLAEVQIELYNKYLELSGQGVDGVFNNKGARLFKDYQNLMKIWTHPWVLKLAEIRDELKMKYDDEDSFIDDSSDEERSFSSGSTSSEDKKMSDSGGEGTSKGAGQKRGTRRTRAKARRQAGEDSDPEEVIAEWKSKTRNQDDDDKVEETERALTKEWWAQFVTEDDKSKLELSNKLTLLFEILRMCEEIGDKVLIFSQSILSLNIIENFLETIDSKFQEEVDKMAEDEDKPDEETFGRQWTKGLDYYRMDGSTSAQNRQAWAQNFNDLDNHRTRLFIISTKAGGLGINLVAANRVIIFDASWNPSHDVQSIFRVYRFGQTKPCYIYRFLAQGTMEEKIYERQVAKLSLSQRVVDEHQIERHFSANDLKELYNFQPDHWNEGKDQKTLALPKDPLLAEILTSKRECIVNFHEHDSLLENQIEQSLTEEEKKAAWEEYENEKKGIIVRGPGMQSGVGASWPMMAAAQVLSREQITATVHTLRQQLPDVPEDLFQLHVQQALRRMVQLKQEEMRRIEMMRMRELNFIQNMMKHEASQYGNMQGMDSSSWLQIQRLRAMQSQMLQGSMGGAGASGMMNSSLVNQLMGRQRDASQQRVSSNNPEDAIDLDASPSK